MDRLSSDKVQQTNQLSNRLLAGRPDFDSRNRWEIIYVSMSKLAPVTSRFLNGCSHGVVTLELGNRSLTLVAYLLLMLKARMHAALPPGPPGSFRNVFFTAQELHTDYHISISAWSSNEKGFLIILTPLRWSPKWHCSCVHIQMILSLIIFLFDAF